MHKISYDINVEEDISNEVRPKDLIFFRTRECVLFQMYISFTLSNYIIHQKEVHRNNVIQHDEENVTSKKQNQLLYVSNWDSHTILISLLMEI